jgi:hypothetical protein
MRILVERRFLLLSVLLAAHFASWLGVVTRLYFPSGSNGSVFIVMFCQRVSSSSGCLHQNVLDVITIADKVSLAWMADSHAFSSSEEKARSLLQMVSFSKRFAKSVWIKVGKACAIELGVCRVDYTVMVGT